MTELNTGADWEQSKRLVVHWHNMWAKAQAARALVESQLASAIKERDEYVHEAEHFQNKCIDLDQANGILKAENERLSSALEYLREERPVSDSFVWKHVDEILEDK